MVPDSAIDGRTVGNLPAGCRVMMLLDLLFVIGASGRAPTLMCDSGAMIP